MMKRYGLLGRTLKHSFSPMLHGLLGNYPYELFEREEEEIPDFLKRVDLGGLNVTIPYKETVMPYLDEIADNAVRIGCVNTILFKEGQLLGYNTDYDGFAGTLDVLKLDLQGAKVVILGLGATSLTVETVCRDRGAREVKKLGRRDLPLESQGISADVLINCTPVGMYPNNGVSPVELGDFSGLSAVIDVVYNPHRTKLLLDARERGIETMDGLTMLAGQAMAAAELFTGTRLPQGTLERVLSSIRKESENIILIGMPGSGKTTLGWALSQVTGKPFRDTDEEIVEEIGMSIPQYFESRGEAAFRRMEKKIIQRLGKETGQIIATGGGIVKDRDNYNPLKQNGRIYFLERELEGLETKDRPLSRGGLETLKKLYEEREPLYFSFADARVNDAEVPASVAWLLEEFNEHCHN